LDRDDTDAWERSLWGPTDHVFVAIIYGVTKGILGTLAGLFGLMFGAAFVMFVLALPGAAIIVMVGAIGGGTGLGFWGGYEKSVTYIGYVAVPLGGLAALAFGGAIGVRQFVYARNKSLRQTGRYDDERGLPHQGPVSDTQSVDMMIKRVRLESYEGCPKCPRNPAEPYDFLSDELAHSGDGTHVLIWEGSVQIPTRCDPFGIHETNKVMIEGLIAAKPYMENGVGYRFGIESIQLTPDQREALRLSDAQAPFRYRCMTGGPNGVASEIGRYIAKSKYQLSQEKIDAVLDGVEGNDRKFFFISLTMSRM
jgi:hypothetical protein